MGNESQPLTADELAAQAAESMFKGGRHGQGDQPRTLEHQRAAADMEKGGGQGGMPGTTKEATGGFTAQAGGKVLDKAKEEDEEEMAYKADDEEEEEGGEEETDMEKMGGKCAKKSEADDIVDADALMKSMDALEAAADGLEEPEVDRRAELAKALEDGTLSDDERTELLELLGAQEPTSADTVVKSEEDVDAEPLEKGFDEVFSSEFSEDYDVSPFLEKFGHTVGASLDILREDMSKSAADQGRFNRALAKSFRGIAQVIQSQQDMIKSLGEQNTALAGRLGIVEQRPVGRKSISSAGQAKPLAKSFAGQEPSELGLSKSDIYKGLHILMAKYKDNGGRARNGEPIDRAVASLEAGAQSISKSLLSEVKEVLS